VNINMIVPTIVAFLSGLVAIRILVNVTVNSKLQYFGYYCLILSAFCFIN
jgi:undecaprenyl pyrophosphate phosphatase UppP